MLQDSGYVEPYMYGFLSLAADRVLTAVREVLVTGCAPGLNRFHWLRYGLLLSILFFALHRSQPRGDSKCRWTLVYGDTRMFLCRRVTSR